MLKYKSTKKEKRKIVNKDYQTFFKFSQSYIEKIIIKEDKIIIYHPHNANPTIYQNTKENKDKLTNRLKDQIKEIIKNESIINENKYKKEQKLILSSIAFTIILTTLLIASLITNNPFLISILITSNVINTASFIALITSYVIKCKKTNQEIKDYQFYIEKCEKLKEQLKNDENMKKYLSDKSQTLLQDNNLDVIKADTIIEKLPKDFSILKERSQIIDGFNNPVSFDYEKYCWQNNSKEKTTNKNKVKKLLRK